MHILITAGNTQTPIDRVRCITNIFSGRTGAKIAEAAASKGHNVCLLTSKPDVGRDLHARRNVRIIEFQTFDDLAHRMEREIVGGSYQAVIHAAAVSDYLVAGVFKSPNEHSSLVDQSAKISSAHDELWIKLTPAPKLIDRIRKQWNFKGTLVKFKLEVGIEEAELLRRGEKARSASDADLLVANTLEDMSASAYIIYRNREAVPVARDDLAMRLIEEMEALDGR